MTFTDFERHVFERLTEVEEGLRELRDVTWPVCQGILEKENGPFHSVSPKRRFFQFIDVDEIKKLLKSKARFMGMSQGVVVEELRQIRVEVPRVASG